MPSQKLDCKMCERLFDASQLRYVEIRHPTGFWEEAQSGWLCDECRGSVKWIPIQAASDKQPEAFFPRRR